MAFAYLSSLIDENSGRSKPWSYEGEEKDEDFFQDAMQEYCYSFFRIATPASYEAFYALSSKLASRFPDNMSFLNNMGSYHLVARNDYKNAYKCYDKVLKMHPDDKDYGSIRDVRVELGQLVHFFLNTVLETCRCIEVTSRKLNIHIDTSVSKDGIFARPFASHLEYIHLFFRKNQVNESFFTNN